MSSAVPSTSQSHPSPPTVARPVLRGSIKATKNKKSTKARCVAAKRKAGPPRPLAPATKDTKAKREVVTDCVFWPALRSHLQGRIPETDLGRVSRPDLRRPSPSLELTCGICRTACLKLPEPVMSNRSAAPVEALSVLPCGHFFGVDCLTRWAESCHQRKQGPGCPACRFPLYQEECGHHIFFRAIASDVVDPCEVGCQVPLLISEGGRVPPSCRSCREEKVRAALDHTLNLILDTSHLTRPHQGNPTIDDFLAYNVGPQVMGAFYLARDGDRTQDEWI